jgi:peptidoglycan/LPS O-acetylase OafA/YrhL
MATLLEIALRLRKGGSIDLHHLLGSLFFVPQAVVPGDYMRPLLGVGWTLNYEMFFYVIFAIALMCGKKTGLGIVFFILGGLVLLGTTIKPLTDTEPPHTLFGFWTDPIMLLFAAGVVIGLIPRIEKWQQMIAYPVTLAAALLGACLTAFLVLHVIFPPPLYWQVGVWLTCSVVVALCIFGRPPRESRTTRGLVHLGDMSYALYLFHFFAVIAAEKMWWLLFGKNPSLLFIPAAYVLSVVSAHAVHHLIEANFDRVLGGRATGGAFRRTAATSDTNPSAAAATQYSPSRPASSAAGVSIRRK